MAVVELYPRHKIQPVGYRARKRPQRIVTVNADDFCTGQGAAKLSAALKSYWFLRGHDVTATTVIGDTAPLRDHHARTDLRSDMVNGLPRGCVWRNGKAVRR